MGFFRIIRVMPIGGEILSMTPVAVNPRIEFTNDIPAFQRVYGNGHLIGKDIVLLFVTAAVFKLLDLIHTRNVITIRVSDRHSGPAAAQHVVIEPSV